MLNAIDRLMNMSRIAIWIARGNRRTDLIAHTCYSIRKCCENWRTISVRPVTDLCRCIAFRLT